MHVSIGALRGLLVHVAARLRCAATGRTLNHLCYVCSVLALWGVIALVCSRRATDRALFSEVQAHRGMNLIRWLNWERFSSDLDANGIHDYETTSIEALCRFGIGKYSQKELQCIAEADRGALGEAAKPCGGYYYAFLSWDEHSKRYDPGSGYAVFAWPDYSVTQPRHSYYHDQDGGCWRKVLDAADRPTRGMTRRELIEGGWRLCG